MSVAQPYQTGMEQRVLRKTAALSAALIAAGVDGMVTEVLSGRHTPPSEMEAAHDAIAVGYCLVQRHAGALVPSLEAAPLDGAAGDDANGKSEDGVAAMGALLGRAVQA